MKTALTAPTTFYVALTGNDANDGLTPATAWGTLQGAWHNMKAGYDFADQPVTVQLANGIYRQGLGATGSIVGQSGAGGLIWKGDESNNENVIVSPIPAGNPFSAAFGACYSIHGIAMDSAGVVPAGADLIAVGQFSAVNIRNVTFYNGVGNGHMAIAFHGHITVEQPGYKIKGGGQYHLNVGSCGTIYYTTDGNPGLVSVTTTGQPSFTVFASATDCGVINCQAVAFNGGAEGRTFQVSNCGVITTRNGNPNYFPGMISGTATTGGQYD